MSYSAIDLLCPLPLLPYPILLEYHWHYFKYLLIYTFVLTKVYSFIVLSLYAPTDFNLYTFPFLIAYLFFILMFYGFTVFSIYVFVHLCF